MGAPGYDDAPRAFVVEGSTPKPVTLVMPYYRNPQWLDKQLDFIAALPYLMRRNVKLFIADDCSPEPAEDVLRLRKMSFPIRLFRIEIDVRWNWIAARNLAMSHAEGWCIVTDIDHVVPATTWHKLIYGRFDEKTMYRFSRTERGLEIHPHPNSFFLTAKTFWKIGGYDEALSGFYGTDGDWRRRCAATVPIRTLKEDLVRFEYELDSSTTHYLRKQPEDAGKKAIIAQRGSNWKPKVLSFPWKEIDLAN